MNIKRWIIAAGLLIMLVGCGQRGEAPLEPTDTPDAGATIDPTPSPVRTGVTILADGVVQSAQPPLPLAFEAGGKLLALHVAAGDIVQAGDLIATLDDTTLQEMIVDTALQVDQAENSLAQAQLTLDDLENWEVDDTAVALAEANLAAAEAALENAEVHDANAGSSLTSASIGIQQAERNLADAQEAYDTAFDPGREWEYNITEPSCLPGQGGGIPCTGPSLHIQMKSEREGAERAVEYAQENLQVARAQYSVAAAGVNNDTAVSAQANLINAQNALEKAQKGPQASEITAARLRVEQAELSLQQSQLNLEKAQNRLDDAQLIAPTNGTILSVDTTPGMLVAAGTPIVTILDSENLQFHTINLSERDLAQIKPGETAVVTLKAYPNDPLDATVQRISLQAGAAVGDAVTFPVILVLDTIELDILPGMTGRAEIHREG